MTIHFYLPIISLCSLSKTNGNFSVFVNCLVKQFAICLGVVVILLLNVMEVFSGGRCSVG